MPVEPGAPPSGAEPKTVLVADDDPRVRLLIVATLEVGPYRLIEAGDGEETLALVRAHQPDLVLLDVGMPLVDGLEVCRRIKADPATSGIPVVFVTGRSQEDDRAAGRAAGGDGYITKPFRPRDLLGEVARRLGD